MTDAPRNRRASTGSDQQRTAALAGKIGEMLQHESAEVLDGLLALLVCCSNQIQRIAHISSADADRVMRAVISGPEPTIIA